MKHSVFIGAAALGIGHVAASKHSKFAPGYYVSGMLGVQTYACVDGDALTKIDPNLAPLPKYVSVLGMKSPVCKSRSWNAKQRKSPSAE